jgi:hypothetical protein
VILGTKKDIKTVAKNNISTQYEPDIPWRGIIKVYSEMLFMIIYASNFTFVILLPLYRNVEEYKGIIELLFKKCFRSTPGQLFHF